MADMRDELLEILASLCVLALQRKVDLPEEETEHIELVLHAAHHQVTYAMLQIHSVTYLIQKIIKRPRVDLLYKMQIGWDWFGKEIKAITAIRSFEELFQFLDILRQFCGAQLPIEAKIVEHALLSLPPLWDFAAIVPCSIAVPSIRCSGTSDLYLLAFQTIEDGSVVARIEISAFRVDPSLAFVTHDPLLAIIAEIEVDLLAIQTEGLFFVLAETVSTQAFHVVLMGEVVLAGLVGLADLVAADVGVGVGFWSFLFGGFVLAGGRGGVGFWLAWGFFVVVLDLFGNAGAKVHWAGL